MQKYIEIKNATIMEFYIKMYKNFRDGYPWGSYLCLGILLLDNQNHNIKLEQKIGYDDEKNIINSLLSICKVDSTDSIKNTNVRVACKDEKAIAIGDERSWLLFNNNSFIQTVSENKLIHY